jgi:dTDP-glucose pyrophosphorylase
MSTPMTARDVTVLIPAAGRVPEGLIALSNIVCPAMIPVGGRPVIHWTMSYLRSLGFHRFVIAVSRPGLFVEEFVDCAFGQDCDVKFIVPSRDEGVGRTIMELSQQVSTAGALVVLGDTHFHFSNPSQLFAANQPLVLTSAVEESYRWCIAQSNPKGELQELHDKVANLEEPLQALIGVYYFHNAHMLEQAATDTVQTAARNGAKAELAGILTRVHTQTPIRVAIAKSWIDCGNADMQAKAHQALLQQRSFNEISIDPVLATLTKRSTHSEKFVDEINYLRLLPPDVAALFPRLLSYSTDWQAPWMQLEYYGYPNLSEVFLFEHVDPGVWERIFTHLATILTQHLGRHQRPVSSEIAIDMYAGKTERRLATMNCSPALRHLVDHGGDVEINGKLVPGLVKQWPHIQTALADVVTRVHGTIIHGDMCLPNILYDLRSRICKFIDPRGSFGTVGVFGDQRYDVAKLWHSIHGHYDFIVNDLFQIAIDGTRVSLSIRASAGHRTIEERCAKVFFQSHNGQAPLFVQRDIQLITGMLFLSMPALHDDAPARQAAMFVRGLQLINEYFEGSP